MSSNGEASSSDSDAGSDSSYNVAPSSAALRNLPSQRMIDHSGWSDNTPPDFHRRFAVGPYYFPASYSGAEGKRPAPPSSSSSMALTVSRSQISSSRTPSLVHSYGTSRSGLSVGTSLASSDLNRYQTLLEEGEDGVMRAPPNAAWQCPFGFLNCHEGLINFEQWDEHCQAHFRGRHNLPKVIQCPFQCPWSCSAASGQQAWSERQSHIIFYHRNGSGIDVNKRPDKTLIEHLWRIGVIDGAQMKQLRTTGRLSEGSVHLQEAGPSQARRRGQWPTGGGSAHSATRRTR